MQNSDFQKFVEIYVPMYELMSNTGVRPSDMAIRMFFDDMHDITLDQFKNACIEHRGNSVFPPKPADIRKLVFGKQEDIKQIEAQDAWEKVNRLLQQHGHMVLTGRYMKNGEYFKTEKLLTPAEHRALNEIGGWTALANMRDSDRVWRKKDFLAAYGQHETALKLEGPQRNVKWLLAGIGG